MPEPHRASSVTSEGRTTASNTRRRRLKHASDTAPDSGSDGPPQPAPRRKSKSSTVSRTARALMAGGGTSALESQVSSGYSPSLGRIAEGRPADGRDVSSRRHRSRRDFRAPAENERQLHDRMRAALTSPSLQSVLSSLTSHTSSSSGSNSTLTQGSYTSRSGRRTSEMNDHRRRRRHHDPVYEADDIAEEKIDVFNYLAADQTNDAAWSSSASSSQDDFESDSYEAHESHDASRAYTPASSVTHSSSDSPTIPRRSSQPEKWPEEEECRDHSGSESAAGSSTGNKQPSVADEAEEAEAVEEIAEANDEHSSSEGPAVEQDWPNHPFISNAGNDPRANVPPPPPPYETDPTALVHYTGVPPPSDHHLATIEVPPPVPEAPSQPRRRRSARLPPKSGYDLLASCVSKSSDTSSSIPPLYRRFSTLNHRLLLHLQDELSELEDALAHVDAAIAYAARGGPQSRRAEAHFGTELTYHRGEILRVVFAKIALYNDALASLARVQGVGRPVSATEVARYRDFVGRVRAVADGEVTFLDAEDLLTLDETAKALESPAESRSLLFGSSMQGTSATPGAQVPFHLLLIPTVATLFSLLLISAAKTSSARLFLVTVFSGAISAATHFTKFGSVYITERERWMCAGGLIGTLVLFGATAA